MSCVAVAVWELVIPMEMAEKLANLELAFYLKVGGLVCRMQCVLRHVVWLPINAQDYVYVLTYCSLWCLVCACVALQLSQNNHYVRPALCRRLKDPANASLFLVGCGAGLAAATPIYVTACLVQVRHMAWHSQLDSHMMLGTLTHN